MRAWLALCLIGCAHPHGGRPDGGNALRDGGGIADARASDGGADALSDGALPDAAVFDGGLPDGVLADAALPDAALPDAALPDAALPDAAPPSCPAGQWCVETAAIPATTILASVWAVSASDVFAVGDAGVIIRRQGGAWTVMTSPTTENLRGVWAASSTDAWAVGSNGAIVHYDGASWTPYTGAGNGNLAAVWGSGASDVWAVGPNMAVHWNGTSWSTSGLGGVPLSVSGTGPTDVWACGEGAKVRHYTGTWSAPIYPIPAFSDYYAITAKGGDVWVSSSYPNRQTLRYAGGTWTPYATGGVVFEGLYEAASNDVWGVGHIQSNPKIGHWTGAAWSVVTPAGVSSALYGVSGAGGEVFVVGSGATILHRD